MKNFIFSFSILFGILFFGGLHTQSAFAQNDDTEAVYLAQIDQGNPDQVAPHEDLVEEAIEEVHHTAPIWLVIPFVALLLMIATGPLFYEHFWHKNYPKIAIGFALLVVFYYLFILGNVHAPVHAMAEYIQFIALLYILLPEVYL